MRPKASEAYDSHPASFEQYRATEPSILVLPSNYSGNDDQNTSFSLILTQNPNLKISEAIDGNDNRHFIIEVDNATKSGGDLTMITFTKGSPDANSSGTNLAIKSVSTASLTDILNSVETYFGYNGIAEINDFFSGLAKHKSMESDEARDALLEVILVLDQRVRRNGITKPSLGAPIELFDLIEARVEILMKKWPRLFFVKRPPEFYLQLAELSRLRSLNGYKDLFATDVFTEAEASGIRPIPSNEELSHRPLRTNSLEERGLSYYTFTTLLTLARNFDDFDKPKKLEIVTKRIKKFKKQKNHHSFARLKQPFGPTFINGYLTLLSKGHISICNTELTTSELHTFPSSHNPFNY